MAVNPKTNIYFAELEKSFFTEAINEVGENILGINIWN